MKRKTKVLLIALYGLALLGGYGLWVCFSYLLVPFGPPNHVYYTPIWTQNGYYKFRPGIAHDPNYKTEITFNSKGFRGAEFEKEKGRSFRIIALGASSTMGAESNDWQTWPFKLQQYLKESGADVEVINAGVAGHASENNLALLKGELLKYQPDVVLYYEGRNDYLIYNFERYPGPERWPRGVLHFFSQWAVYKKAQLRFIVLKATGFDIGPGQWEKKYKANLEAMAIESGKAKVPFVIVTQILDYPIDLLEALTKNPELDRQSLVEHMSMRNEKWQLYFRHLDVLRVQKQVATAHSLMVFDLHEEFVAAQKQGASLFYDDVHLTPRGNEVIGQALAHRVKEQFHPPLTS